MSTLSLTGAARIGRMRASGPLAKLTVSPDLLEIQSAIGYVCFQPEDVKAFRVQRSWWYGYGLVIEHNLPNYPKKVLFSTGTNPEALREKVIGSGFGDPAKTSPNPPQLDPNRYGGFPFQGWVVVMAYGLMFGGIFLDILLSPYTQMGPLMGWGVRLGLGLVVCGLLAIRFVPPVQAKVFKPGMGVGHARYFLNFVTPISAFVFLMFMLIGLGG